MQMKELTRMTGTLTNVQSAQLKMWPRIILGANNAEIEFDPENNSVAVDMSDLDYKSMLEGVTEDPVTIYSRRMAKFDTAVKWLLGDDYAVTVRLKGHAIGQFPAKSLPIRAHMPKDEKK